MEIEVGKRIMGVITQDPSLVLGGASPVFYARDRTEQDRIATYLARITEGVVHDLENGVYLVVKH